MARKRPGTKSTGHYYRIVLKPSDNFITFRNHDVGDPGHIQRLVGKKRNGSWDTQAWLVSKKDAHKQGDSFVADTKDAKDLLKDLGAQPKHVKGDVFKV